MPDSKKQLTQEEYLKHRSKLKMLLIVLGAVLLILAGVVGYNLTHPNTGGLNGTYTCQLTEEDSYIFQMHLDETTAEFMITVGTDDRMSSGTYCVKGNTLTLKNGDTKSEYDIIGDCLLGTGYYYEGSIPDGDTFDASITQTTDAYSLKLDFASDGTYTSTITSGSDGDSSDTTAVTKGTYRREGEFLYRTRQEEDGGEMPAPRLMILHCRVNSNFYIKDK